MVIDASALMAFLLDESGASVVEEMLTTGTCAICAVNYAEVVGKLVGNGSFTPDQVEARLLLFRGVLSVLPFDSRLVDFAAFLYARRRPYNLSLGDCACLALAQSRAEPVLTAEQGWARLPDLGVQVQVIR